MKTIPISLFSRSSMLLGSAYKISRILKAARSENFSAEAFFSSKFAAQIAEIVGTDFSLMKGSVLKLGQQFSVLGEHILPEAANQILRKMQYDSGEQPWPLMAKVLQDNFNVKFFEEFNIIETARAAGSIGQVHDAVQLKTGQKICLKIQYPKIERFIESDLKLLKFFLTASRIYQSSVATDEIFAEVASMLKAETRFDTELKNINFFTDALKQDSFFKVVKPVFDYCNRKILATEFVPGFHIDNPTLANYLDDQKNIIGPKFLDLLFREIFVWHKIQSDPHGGNFLFEPQTNTVTLIDFGAVRTFSQSFIQGYRSLVKSALFNDYELFLETAEKMKLIEQKNQKSHSLNVIFELLKLTLTPFQNDEPFDFGTSDLPKRAVQKSFELLTHFKITSPPREFIFLNRKIAGTYTLLKMMKANFPARQALLPFIN